MNSIPVFLSILLLILISGCIGTTVYTSQGISMKLQADPPKIFAGTETNLYVEIENLNQKTLKNVEINVFDTGALKKTGECKTTVNRMLPNQIVSLRCKLKAPEQKNMIEPTERQTVSVSVKFEDLTVVLQTFDIVSENYYRTEDATGKFQKKPKSYSYRDNNVEIDVDFSSDLPIIYREDRQEIVYFTVKNIGNGFIGNVTCDKNFAVQEPNDQTFVDIRSESNMDRLYDFAERFIFKEILKESGTGKRICTDAGVVECEDFGTLLPMGKTFSRIACKLNLDQILQDRDFVIDYEIIPILKYTYEVRGTIDINVAR